MSLMVTVIADITQMFSSILWTVFIIKVALMCKCFKIQFIIWYNCKYAYSVLSFISSFVQERDVLV